MIVWEVSLPASEAEKGNNPVADQVRLTPEDFAQWEAQNFQLIAFPVAAAPVMDQTWFNHVTGAGDEIERTTKKNHLVDKAVIGDRVISLTVETGKITWLELPHRPTEELTEGFPTLGLLVKEHDRFVRMMERWLPLCPSIYRLAFATKLMRKSVDTVDSYNCLSKYVHAVDIDPEGSSDFLYRINRRRESAVLKGRYINRLSTWSALKFKFEMGMLAGVVEKPLVQNEFSCCTVDLDINTGPEDESPIDPAAIVPLLNELRQLAMEIAERGDVK